MAAKQELARYIRSLRNAAKRDYALNYVNWSLSIRHDHEPEPVRARGLSYMAAQAVRLNIASILSAKS